MLNEDDASLSSDLPSVALPPPVDPSLLSEPFAPDVELPVDLLPPPPPTEGVGLVSPVAVTPPPPITGVAVEAGGNSIEGNVVPSTPVFDEDSLSRIRARRGPMRGTPGEDGMTPNDTPEPAFLEGLRVRAPVQQLASTAHIMNLLNSAVVSDAESVGNMGEPMRDTPPESPAASIDAKGSDNGESEGSLAESPNSFSPASLIAEVTLDSPLPPNESAPLPPTIEAGLLVPSQPAPPLPNIEESPALPSSLRGSSVLPGLSSAIPPLADGFVFSPGSNAALPPPVVEAASESVSPSEGDDAVRTPEAAALQDLASAHPPLNPSESLVNLMGTAAEADLDADSLYQLLTPTDSLPRTVEPVFTNSSAPENIFSEDMLAILPPEIAVLSVGAPSEVHGDTRAAAQFVTVDGFARDMPSESPTASMDAEESHQSESEGSDSGYITSSAASSDSGSSTSFDSDVEPFWFTQLSQSTPSAAYAPAPESIELSSVVACHTATENSSPPFRAMPTPQRKNGDPVARRMGLDVAVRSGRQRVPTNAQKRFGVNEHGEDFVEVFIGQEPKDAGDVPEESTEHDRLLSNDGEASTMFSTHYSRFRRSVYGRNNNAVGAAASFFLSILIGVVLMADGESKGNEKEYDFGIYFLIFALVFTFLGYMGAAWWNSCHPLPEEDGGDLESQQSTQEEAYEPFNLNGVVVQSYAQLELTLGDGDYPSLDPELKTKYILGCVMNLQELMSSDWCGEKRNTLSVRQYMLEKKIPLRHDFAQLAESAYAVVSIERDLCTAEMRDNSEFQQNLAVLKDYMIQYPQDALAAGYETIVAPFAKISLQEAVRFFNDYEEVATRFDVQQNLAVLVSVVAQNDDEELKNFLSEIGIPDYGLSMRMGPL